MTSHRTGWISDVHLGTRGCQAEALLEFLRDRPDGATDEEIASGLGLNPSTERPRRIELQRRGLVVEAGTRKPRSGRYATAWRLA